MHPTLDDDAQGEEGAEGEKENQDASNAQLNASGLSGGGTYKMPADRRPVKDTPSLRVLQGARAAKTVKDVEDEFK